MKIWFQKNYKTVITLAFLIPIITVAIVSISHVTQWYGITNPISWAIYLSVGIEIAALSSLAAISVDMGRKVYFPFGVATLIQFIGNVFFAYSFIDANSDMFKSWVELSSPIISLFGVESTDIIANKRFLAFFAGGMLPVISLSFLHMLIRFTEDENMKKINENLTINNPTDDGIKLADDILKDVPPLTMAQIMDELSKVRSSEGHTVNNPTVVDDPIDPSFVMSELSRVRPTEEELEILENILLKKEPAHIEEVSTNITEDQIKRLETILLSNSPIEDDFSDNEVDFSDELEELENEVENQRENEDDHNYNEELDQELINIIPDTENIENETESLDDSGFPILVEAELIDDGDPIGDVYPRDFGIDDDDVQIPEDDEILETVKTNDSMDRDLKFKRTDDLLEQGVINKTDFDIWSKIIKERQEKIDNGEKFEDEPTALANSGLTEKLDDIELDVDGTFGTDPDPIDNPDKKKTLDPLKEGETNISTIKEEISQPKSVRFVPPIIENNVYIK